MTEKKVIVLAAVFAAAAFAALLGACGNGPSPKQENEMGLRDFSFSIPLSPEALSPKAQNPRMNFSLSLLEVNEPESDAQFFNQLLYSGKGPGAYRDALAKKYQDLYRDEQSLIAAAGIAGQPGFDWEYRETMDFSGLREKGMVLERKIEYYTGGAHGMQSAAYYVIDLEEHKILGLADLFREPDGAALRDMVREALRDYSGGRGFPLEKGQPLSAGIFLDDNPEVSADFFVSQEGLGLQWDPYEIAPYAAGSIEIILPWRELRPLMKTEGMEKLTKFGIYLFV